MTWWSLSQISGLEEALMSVDNRSREWWTALSPLGQFVAAAAVALKMAYEIPLATDIKRYAGALFIIAEERDIHDQLAGEREKLKNQREVMLRLEDDFKRLMEASDKQLDLWKSYLATGVCKDRQLTPEIRAYYEDMIKYLHGSCDRIVLAMKKVTATVIDSQESLLFNDLQQNSTLVCFMQNRTHLRQQLKAAKQKRLEIERVHLAVSQDMDFLRNSAPLDSVHIPRLPIHEAENDAK